MSKYKKFYQILDVGVSLKSDSAEAFFTQDYYSYPEKSCILITKVIRINHES